MIFYALVAADSNFTVELYPTPEAAERALRDVLFDEPGFRDLLGIEPVELDERDVSAN